MRTDIRDRLTEAAKPLSCGEQRESIREAKPL